MRRLAAFLVGVAALGLSLIALVAVDVRVGCGAWIARVAAVALSPLVCSRDTVPAWGLLAPLLAVSRVLGEGADIGLRAAVPAGEALALTFLVLAPALSPAAPRDAAFYGALLLLFATAAATPLAEDDGVPAVVLGAAIAYDLAVPDRVRSLALRLSVQCALAAGVAAFATWYNLHTDHRVGALVGFLGVLALVARWAACAARPAPAWRLAALALGPAAWARWSPACAYGYAAAGILPLAVAACSRALGTHVAQPPAYRGAVPAQPPLPGVPPTFVSSIVCLVPAGVAAAVALPDADWGWLYPAAILLLALVSAVNHLEPYGRSDWGVLDALDRLALSACSVMAVVLTLTRTSLPAACVATAILAASTTLYINGTQLLFQAGANRWAEHAQAGMHALAAAGLAVVLF